MTPVSHGRPLVAAAAVTSAARITSAVRFGRLRAGWLAEVRAAAVPVALAFTVTRLVIALVVWISQAIIPNRPGGFLHAAPDNLLLDGLVRFDSWWYREIVRAGYTAGSIETGQQGTVAFFPLYPMLVKGVSFVTGNVYVAGVLVSNCCFLLALVALWCWARTDLGDDAAGRTIFYLAAAPTAVFFSAMYTESLYVLLVASTFLLARRGRFWLAAIPAILASATRNTGVLMAAVIALEALQQAGVRLGPPGWRPRAIIAFAGQQAMIAGRAWKNWLPAFLAPLGLFAYMAYLSNRFGDPLAFIHAQATWGRETNPGGFLRLLPHTVSQLGIESFAMGRFNAVAAMDVFFTLLFLPLVVAVVLRTRWSYAVYCGLTFVVPLATGSVGSMSRYVLMLLPCYLLLGVWGRRIWVDRIVLGLSLPLFAYFAVLFSHWWFAG